MIVLEDGRKIFFTVTLARGAGGEAEGGGSKSGAARAASTARRARSSGGWLPRRGAALAEGKRGVPVAATVMLVWPSSRPARPASSSSCAETGRRQSQSPIAVQPEGASTGKEEAHASASETPGVRAPRTSGTEQPAPARPARITTRRNTPVGRRASRRRRPEAVRTKPRAAKRQSRAAAPAAGRRTLRGSAKRRRGKTSSGRRGRPRGQVAR